MGYDGKYGKITTEYDDIPDDEPVIVFRARDIATDKLLPYYAMLCMKAGSPSRHIALIQNAHERFRNWREKTGAARIPDSNRSREWMDDKLSVRD